MDVLEHAGNICMTDRALKTATERREALAALINGHQQQLDKWRKDLAKVDSWIAGWHVFSGENSEFDELDFELPATAPPPDSEDEFGAARKKKARNNSKKEEVAAAARKLIEEKGEPMSREELFDQLTSMGLRIEGADPRMVLSTMLWRMKDVVVRLNSGGYWLTGIPRAKDHYFGRPDIDALFGSVADDEPPASDEDDD